MGFVQEAIKGRRLAGLSRARPRSYCELGLNVDGSRDLFSPSETRTFEVGSDAAKGFSTGHGRRTLCARRDEDARAVTFPQGLASRVFWSSALPVSIRSSRSWDSVHPSLPRGLSWHVTVA